MTRFEETTPADRRKLVAEAVRAHRERASPYLTLEAEGEDDDGPWVQFAEDVCNLDCTDEELDRLTALLGEFPAFKIRERERPDDAEGTNLKVGALADPARIGQFVERVFREVYERPADYRLWAAAV